MFVLWQCVARILLNRLETEFFQQLPVALLAHKESSLVVAVFCFQYADAILGTGIFTLMPDPEIADFVAVKKIANDHFCLTLAIAVASVWHANVNP